MHTSSVTSKMPCGASSSDREARTPGMDSSDRYRRRSLRSRLNRRHRSRSASRRSNLLSRHQLSRRPRNRQPSHLPHTKPPSKRRSQMLRCALRPTTPSLCKPLKHIVRSTRCTPRTVRSIRFTSPDGESSRRHTLRRGRPVPIRPTPAPFTPPSPTCVPRPALRSVLPFLPR